MNPQDWTLIGLALAAVALLVLLVTRLKVNGFIALVLASLLVGGGAVWPERVQHATGGREQQPGGKPHRGKESEIWRT